VIVVSVLLLAVVLSFLGLDQGQKGNWSRASLLLAIAAGLGFGVFVSLAGALR
jgi:hypothetical protein